MKKEISSLSKLFQKTPYVWIFELLKKYPSANVYLVGGAVRDFILGKETKDYDFVVQGIRAKECEKFLLTQGQVHFVGRRFGVYKFIPRPFSDADSFEPFDIALPRTEQSHYGTGHYRDFIIKTDHRLSIEDDLSRRDFTINAICYDIRKNIFRDPWNGIGDINKKIIRTVGAPYKRFSEDYSRMLRAIRFACQLNFHIDRTASLAIKKYSPRLQDFILQFEKKEKKTKEVRRVAYEIIASECVRAFVSNHELAFDLFDHYRLFKILMPELERMKKCPQDPTWHSEGDVWTHTRLALSKTYGKEYTREFGHEERDPLLMLSVLFHDLGKPYTLQTPKKHRVDRIHCYGHDRVGAQKAKAIAERLRFSSVPKYHISSDAIEWLVKNHLLLLNSDISTMKHTTLEKYFFKDPYLGKLLLRLIFIDSCATVRKDGKSSLGNYRACKKRLQALRLQPAKTQQLVKPLMSGYDIMTTCALKPGKLVGALLSELREEQLAGRITTKREAQIYVKRTYLIYCSRQSKKNSS